MKITDFITFFNKLMKKLQTAHGLPGEPDSKPLECCQPPKHDRCARETQKHPKQGVKPLEFIALVSQK